MKYLVGVTPIYYVSDCYGGRVSDEFVEDIGFLKGDPGFKLHDTSWQYPLTIPPSKHRNLQMTSSNVKSTSIYVEYAIKRTKDFQNVLPLNLLHLLGDFVILICTRTNLLPHLCAT